MLEKKEVAYTKYQITNDATRILFFFKHKDIAKAIRIIKKVFGVYSLSPALRTSNRIKNISDRAIEIGNKILDKNDSFALRVKRSGKHDFTSQDVAKKVGQDIIDNFSELGLSVDLSNPDKKIFIEVRNEFSYLFTDIIETPWEGLPIEYKKKVGVMDVGRQSDLLAGFMLMRRGCEIYPVLFDLKGDIKTKNIWISNWREVFDFTPFSKFTLRIVDLLPILDKLKSKLDKKEYFCALCRIIRFKIFKGLMDESIRGLEEIQGFTDGLNFNGLNICTDLIDLESLVFNDLFSDLPVFTPLIGFEEKEISDFLDNISESMSKIEYCIYKPKTQEIDIETVKKIFNTLQLEELIQEAIENVKDMVLS
jgi:thiamine biosynthesis protein ThiI